MKVVALEEISRISQEKERERKLQFEIDEMMFGKDYLIGKEREADIGNAYQAIR